MQAVAVEAPPKRGFLSKRAKLAEEEITSESEEEDNDVMANQSAHHVDSDDETAEEKRLRLTKVALAALHSEHTQADGLVDTEASAEEQSGRLQRCIAADTRASWDESHSISKHWRSPTCVTLSSDATKVISASKDGAVIVCDSETGQLVHRIAGHGKSSELQGSHGHQGAVNAIALDTHDQLLVTGGQDKLVRVWDFRSFAHIKSFEGHRAGVTALAIRRGHKLLFSGASDKFVKAWNLDTMGYMDTMFGHTDSVTGLTALSRERCLSAGARDRSLRMWKVVDESQLVFNVPVQCASIDCLAMLNEDHFVSGAQDGSICLWSTFKKKPVSIHQHNETSSKGVTDSAPVAWVNCMAACPYTDLLATGSNDGMLKLWQVSRDYRKLTSIASKQLPGICSSVCMSDDGRLLAAAVSKEHRFGRWFKSESAKESITLVPLQYNNEKS